MDYVGTRLPPVTDEQLDELRDRELDEIARLKFARSAPEQAQEPPKPVRTGQRTRNPLRPSTFDEVIGQDGAVAIMRRVTEASARRDEPLDHVLLVGASGTGKSTFSHVIAAELGVDVYEAEAPIDSDMLLSLREVMNDGDILRIEEIHQQAIMERRGKSASTQPEVLYAVLEDRVISRGSEILRFPAITVIGTTTDEGMLPDPFLNRFPIRPHLEPYDVADIGVMAIWNAEKLDRRITVDAAWMLAEASRGVPRQVNNYIKNAVLLCDDLIDEDVAGEVLFDLNGVSADGLTRDMQNMLLALLTKGKRESAKGEITYQMSVATLATLLGKSRDSKAVVLRVEPFLLEQGFVQVGHGGRTLTHAGVHRAEELVA
jgi:Holliday junction DNA helicase RuvB